MKILDGDEIIQSTFKNHSLEMLDEYETEENLSDSEEMIETEEKELSEATEDTERLEELKIINDDEVEETSEGLSLVIISTMEDIYSNVGYDCDLSDIKKEIRCSYSREAAMKRGAKNNINALEKLWTAIHKKVEKILNMVASTIQKLYDMLPNLHMKSTKALNRVNTLLSTNSVRKSNSVDIGPNIRGTKMRAALKGKMDIKSISDLNSLTNIHEVIKTLGSPKSTINNNKSVTSYLISIANDISKFSGYDVRNLLLVENTDELISSFKTINKNYMDFINNAHKLSKGIAPGASRFIPNTKNNKAESGDLIFVSNVTYNTIKLRQCRYEETLKELGDGFSKISIRTHVVRPNTIGVKAVIEVPTLTEIKKDLEAIVQSKAMLQKFNKSLWVHKMLEQAKFSNPMVANGLYRNQKDFDTELSGSLRQPARLRALSRKIVSEVSMLQRNIPLNAVRNGYNILRERVNVLNKCMNMYK